MSKMIEKTKRNCYANLNHTDIADNSPGNTKTLSQSCRNIGRLVALTLSARWK